MTEIKLFYDWLETHELSAMGIALWHALMQIASRSGWQPELRVSLSTLVGRSSLSRTSVYKERDILRRYGLIDYRMSGGRGTGIYKLQSLETRFVSAPRTQSGTQAGDDTEIASRNASASRTQGGIQVGTDTSSLRLNYSKLSEEKKEVAGEPATVFTNSPPQKEKSCGQKEREPAPLFDVACWLANTNDPWRELMTLWLEYKRSRRERYKSELSVRKCLSQLRLLADNDPHVAWQIIDQSIANNWAGLFPLRNGQHPGQILRPANDARTRSLLEKFGRKDKVGQ